MIDRLIDLCSKTRPACQFAESLSTQENFWDEFDLGGNTLTINTAKDGWGNLFDVEWKIYFILKICSTIMLFTNSLENQ